MQHFTNYSLINLDGALQQTVVILGMDQLGVTCGASFVCV